MNCTISLEERLEASRTRSILLLKVFPDARKALLKSQDIPMCLKCGNPDVVMLTDKTATELHNAVDEELTRLHADHSLFEEYGSESEQ